MLICKFTDLTHWRTWCLDFDGWGRRTLHFYQLSSPGGTQVNMEPCVWISIVLWRHFLSPLGGNFMWIRRSRGGMVSTAGCPAFSFQQMVLPYLTLSQGWECKADSVFAFRGFSYCGEEASDRWFQGLEEKTLGGICTDMTGEGLLSSVWDF